MIPVEVADPIRYLDAALALLLCVSSAWAAMLPSHWNQRVRFAIFAAFGVALTGGHLTGLGRPSNWWLIVLMVIVAAALVSTAAYIHRELRDRRAR